MVPLSPAFTSPFTAVTCAPLRSKASPGAASTTDATAVSQRTLFLSTTYSRHPRENRSSAAARFVSARKLMRLRQVPRLQEAIEILQHMVRAYVFSIHHGVGKEFTAAIDQKER